MTSVTRFAGARWSTIFLIAAAVLAVGVFALPSPALADGHGHGNGHGNGHGGNGHGGNGHGGGPNHAAIEGYPMVPRVIAVERRGYYQPYYGGQVYYAAHHHYHTEYRFPVYINGAVAYRPYDYCGNTLFVSGGVPLPHLAFGINFGSPGGISVSGYYGSPGVVVPPVPYPYLGYPALAPYPYPGAVVYYPQPYRRHHDEDYDGD